MKVFRARLAEQGLIVVVFCILTTFTSTREHYTCNNAVPSRRAVMATRGWYYKKNYVLFIGTYTICTFYANHADIICRLLCNEHLSGILYLRNKYLLQLIGIPTPSQTRLLTRSVPLTSCLKQ